MFKQIIILIVFIQLSCALIVHGPNENDHGACEQVNREIILGIQQEKDVTARIIAVPVSLSIILFI